MPKHIVHVVGARPNFMKLAPLFRALTEFKVNQTVVHTGQHYDSWMSDVFFEDLSIPLPEVNLHVGSASHAQQTAAIMARIEPVFLERKPDMVIVYGDVNSTIAAALVASKLGIAVVHVEAGLRSGDRTMPEEINRLVTDQLSDLLFTPSMDGNLNLSREGIASSKTHFVGNIMIDSLIRLLPKALRRKPESLPEKYALVTLHRPSNVDDLSFLQEVVYTLGDIASDLPVLFPIHPRTRSRLEACGAVSRNGITYLEPLAYSDFLCLQSAAAVVITDSGGVQEETTYLGVPCLTLRENTERPVTVSEGTNTLVGRDVVRLRREVELVIEGNPKRGAVPALWDGRTAYRIAPFLIS